MVGKKHRDIKPLNFLVFEGFIVKLADLGFTKDVNLTEADT